MSVQSQLVLSHHWSSCAVYDTNDPQSCTCYQIVRNDPNLVMRAQMAALSALFEMNHISRESYLRAMSDVSEKYVSVMLSLSVASRLSPDESEQSNQSTTS